MHVTPQGWAPKTGGPRQVPRSPPLKHTTACTHNKSAILPPNVNLTCSGVLHCDKRLINFDVK